MNLLDETDRGSHATLPFVSEGPKEDSAMDRTPLEALTGLLPAPGRRFFENLVRQRILDEDSARGFLHRSLDRLGAFDDIETLGSALIEDGTITHYQFERLLTGASFGLILGNHRILDRLGSGGMGVVFRAEHIYMKRQVAVKVLPMSDECPAYLVSRFHAEISVLAALHHPNIVTAYDSGQLASTGPGVPELLYLAMELVDGGDLDTLVNRRGPVDVPTACEWIRQAANGLDEAHRHRLIHRDIKPSNLLLRNSDQVKLVDFGLVQQYHHRQTEKGDFLGTIEYMPPEQSRDSSSIGTAADIYGLGATLFRLLTGEPPYPRTSSFSSALRMLQNTLPRRLRSLRRDVRPSLDILVAEMLDPDPVRRPGSARTVARLLEPFASRA